MTRLRAALAAALLAGCSSPPDPARPAPERYADAHVAFEREADAMIRHAGRNRLRVEGSAGRARAALESMRDMLEGEPAARLAALGERFAALSRTIAADNGLSGGQERAVTAIRDEVARDFAPSKVAVVSREAPPPEPAPPDAFARWEAAHRAFAEHARGGETARLVQDASDLRASMDGFAKSGEDRFRVERFLREYERLAELGLSGALSEQDLKGLPVIEADVRAAFGGRK